MNEFQIKEAAFFAEIWERLRDLFNADARKARRDVSEHFGSEDPSRWDRFLHNAQNSPEFIRKLERSSRADEKLVSYARGMAALSKAPVVGKIESEKVSGQNYEVKRLPGGQLGCTCNDWRYNGSFDPGYRCKHIKAHEQGLTKVAGKDDLFRRQTESFFDELRKIHQHKLKNSREDDREGSAANENTLTRDTNWVNPRPAQPIDEIEVITRLGWS